MVSLSPYSSFIATKPVQFRQNAPIATQPHLQSPQFAGPRLEELDEITAKQKTLEERQQKRYRQQAETLQELLPHLDTLMRTNTLTRRRITALEVTRVVAEKSGILESAAIIDTSADTLENQILARKKAMEKTLKQQQQDKKQQGFIARLLSPPQSTTYKTPVHLNLRNRYEKSELADFQTIVYRLMELGILKRPHGTEHFNINDISLTPLGKAYLDSKSDARFASLPEPPNQSESAKPHEPAERTKYSDHPFHYWRG